MKLYICSTCQQHITERQCQHCSTNEIPTRSNTPSIALAVLLGLGLTACGDKDDDTAEEPPLEEDIAALYGVEEADE
jgi:hypothetical protein